MRRKILIRAYVNTNLGDDLFIKMLCDRYSRHQFYLIGLEENILHLKQIKNLSIIKPVRYIDSLFKRIKLDFSVNEFLEKELVKGYDAVIHIGGSIFIEQEDNWIKKANNYEKTINNSKCFFVLGSNFGPYNNPEYFIKYQNIFKHVNDICFRDKNSFDKFSHLSNARLAPDIVFSLNSSNIKADIEDNIVLISVIDLSWRKKLKEYTEIYEKTIIDISKRLIQDGKKVVLMSFCADEGDERAINRIMSKYSDPKLSSYFYKGDISKSLSLIKSADAIIATRFHSLILAFVFEKNVFPFVYSNKTSNLLKDINYEGYFLSLESLSNIDINQVISQLTNVKFQDVTNEIKEAEKHFMKTDEFLSS